MIFFKLEPKVDPKAKFVNPRKNLKTRDLRPETRPEQNQKTQNPT